MLSLLSLILGPVVGLLDKIFGYVSNVETTRLTTEAAVQEATITGTAAVEQRWWFVAALIPAFSIPYVAYYGKIVLWDNVLMGGEASTPALHGSADTVGWIVVTGIFLHGAIDRFVK